MGEKPETTISRLLRLPTELLEAVASEATTNDLLSLRLTCKEIESKVFRVLTTRCFTDRTFVMFCPWNMKVLEKISSHPRFSKSLRSIAFLPSAIEYPKYEEQWNVWAKTLRSDKSTTGNEW